MSSKISTAEFLKKVRAIELSSRRMVKQGMAGQYQSAFRGTGVQFREFRNYEYGDDVRHISWTVSARAQEPVIKTFEEERERTLFLLVDVSASLRRGALAREKSEKIAEIAGTLALSAAQSNDKFGLLLFSDRIENVVPPKKGKNHLLRCIRDIIGFQAQGRGTDPDLALRKIDQVLKKQSIVFLLSDFEVMPSEMLLRRTSSIHEFSAIGVRNPFEWKLPSCGFVEIETAERARPMTIDSSSKGMRLYFEHFGKKTENKTQDFFQRSACDFLWVDSFEDFVFPLQNFLKKRGRR